MVKITLDITKSVNENAQSYFEKAKRAKKKLQGVAETRTRMLERAKKEQSAHNKVVGNKPKQVEKRKKHWFEKFRWTFLANSMLAVGGRDATTNEIVIKKHVEPQDKILHTDMSGAPFIVIKSEGKQIEQDEEKEAALICGAYSRAWQRKLSTIEVFSATPDQVTKQAQTGEYLSKGAFMIRGKVTYYHPKLVLAIGKYEHMAIAGYPSTIKKMCNDIVCIIPGDMKTSDIAKKIAHTLEIQDVDDVLRVLPTGGCAVIPYEQVQWY